MGATCDECQSDDRTELKGWEERVKQIEALELEVYFEHAYYDNLMFS